MADNANYLLQKFSELNIQADDRSEAKSKCAEKLFGILSRCCAEKIENILISIKRSGLIEKCIPNIINYTESPRVKAEIPTTKLSLIKLAMQRIFCKSRDVCHSRL